MGEAAASDKGRGIAAIVLAVAALALGIILGVIGTFVLPGFQTVLASYGDKLPMLTSVVLDSHYLLWAPLFLALVLWWPLRSNTARIYCYAVMIPCEILLIPFLIIVMYLPIYELGLPAGS